MHINAASWVLMNYQTGDVISKHNENEKRQAASLTKLMTAYIVASEIKQGIINISDTTTISKKAASIGGSSMFLKEGQTVSVENLLYGLIIQSGNDSAVAIAEFIAGTEDAFVSIMNQTAQALKMENTLFSDANGLPGGDQYTTAYDMALLSRAFIYRFPEIYKLFSKTSFTWNDIKQPNPCKATKLLRWRGWNENRTYRYCRIQYSCFCFAR